MCLLQTGSHVPDIGTREGRIVVVQTRAWATRPCSGHDVAGSANTGRHPPSLWIAFSGRHADRDAEVGRDVLGLICRTQRWLGLRTSGHVSPPFLIWSRAPIRHLRPTAYSPDIHTTARSRGM